MQAMTVTDPGVEATLDAVSGLHDLRTDADAGLFELAARFADLHPGAAPAGSLPGSRTVVPGKERAVQVGGVGTPRIAEFAYSELGARMQMGTWSAKRYVADALDVRHRLPLIWARVQAREARIGNARLVADKTRHLSVEAAATVDAAMVPFVDGSLPWGRFETRLDGKIVAADPPVAAAREEDRVRGQFAKRTRSSENGMAGFYVWSTVGVIARLDATVAFLADALQAFGDTDREDLRRVKAVALLANPVRAVELLAAAAALRSRNEAAGAGATGPAADDPSGEPVDRDDEPLPEPEPEPDAYAGVEAGPDTEASSGPVTGARSDVGSGADPCAGSDSSPEPDLLDRIDAFARRVGFTPTRLPAWLAARATHIAEDPAHPSRPRAGHSPPPPGFVFDWSRLLPALTLHLHLTAGDLTRSGGGVVRWEGEGPVTHQFVHQHLRPLHRYLIQPVIDLPGMAPVDAYEVPDRLRKAVHLRTPADTFPFSSGTSRRVDVDHTETYDPALAAGPQRHWSTRAGNLGPLGRFGHRIKTHGRWTLRQPFDGIFVWRDPHGQIYLVDHTGTHQATRPGQRAGATRPHDPDVEVYPADTVIEVDLT